MMDDIYRQIAKGYCVFDLETTGFSPLNDVIIEIAARKVLLGGVINDREWLVRIAPRKIPENIVALTGLTDDDLDKKGVLITQALEQFAAFSTGLPLVGHNVLRFDRSFLVSTALHDKSPQFLDWPPHRFIDTAALFKGFKMSLQMGCDEAHHVWAIKVLDTRITGLKYNLDFACHEVGIGNRDRTEHRAMPDVIRVHGLFKKLMEMGRAPGQSVRFSPTDLVLSPREVDAILVRW